MKRNYFTTIAVAAALIAGYAAYSNYTKTLPDNSENSNSEATPISDTSPAEQVIEPASTAPEVSSCFDELISSFGAVSDKTELVKRLSINFDSRLENYKYTCNDLAKNYPETMTCNIIRTSRSDVINGYSPMARFFSEYSHSFRINPVLAAEKIAPVTAVSSEFTSYICDRSKTFRNPQTGRSNEDIITGMLARTFNNEHFNVGYSPDEDLYYTYLVSACNNISVTALYFRFDDRSVLRNIGCDSFIYSGGELAYLDDSTSTPHIKPINLDYAGGERVYTGSEPTTLYNMTDTITGILGSSVIPANVVTGGTVTSSDLVKPFFVKTDAAGSLAPAGVYYSSWFTLD